MLVSSLFGKNSIPGWIVQQVRNNVIIPLIGDEILKEYNEVLYRNKFPFKKNVIEGEELRRLLNKEDKDILRNVPYTINAKYNEIYKIFYNFGSSLFNIQSMFCR